MTNSAYDQFVHSAQEHGRLSLEGVPAHVNAAFGRLQRAAVSLRVAPDKGAASFLAMLSHPDESVKTWAALYCLPIREAEARRELEAVASGTGLIAFNARMTLREWDAGRLKAP
jgi:hypothetical protein